MGNLLKLSAAWIAGHASGALFTTSLAMLSAGCACYDPPLGLIVPGAIIVGLMAFMHLYNFCRGG